MKLNEDKSNYMIFSRARQDFATRLKLNHIKLDRVHETRLLGVLIQDNLKWDLNTQDICRRAYDRILMITKLKYVGVSQKDLIDV